MTHLMIVVAELVRCSSDLPKARCKEGENSGRDSLVLMEGLGLMRMLVVKRWQCNFAEMMPRCMTLD